MIRAILLLSAGIFALAGCGQSGGINETPTSLIPERRASILDAAPEEDLSVLVSKVTDLVLEERPGGAILRVSGLASTLGAHSIRLVAPDEGVVDGELTLAFRVVEAAVPGKDPAEGHPVIAALWLTEQTLRGLSLVRVSGETNAIELSF